MLTLTVFILLGVPGRGVFCGTAERCLQTAQAMAQGLFPNGTGPPGFPNQPIAVQTEQVGILLACDGTVRLA